MAIALSVVVGVRRISGRGINGFLASSVVVQPRSGEMVELARQAEHRRRTIVKVRADALELLELAIIEILDAELAEAAVARERDSHEDAVVVVVPALDDPPAALGPARYDVLGLRRYQDRDLLRLAGAEAVIDERAAPADRVGQVVQRLHLAEELRELLRLHRGVGPLHRRRVRGPVVSCGAVRGEAAARLWRGAAGSRFAAGGGGDVTVFSGLLLL